MVGHCKCLWVHSPQIDCFCFTHTLLSGSDSLKHYEGIFIKSFSQSATISWHRHQRGIFAGCTLSIILFLAGMNIILEYSMQARVPQFTTNNTLLPLLRAFMDHLSLMSSTVSGAQALLSRCITALNWAGLEFRADKSCSIVIVKGRSMNTTPFSVSKVSDQPDFHLGFLPFTRDQSNFWVA